ncbi:ABC transporter permease [Clostridium lacusfryxellense]|uniref:ABC transporter permease n=1 Tax=Clostridium lacusfryxellense TaxID=205328 RepID=UPI001C0CF932|nr:ABC transporter permease [Clostridium lacusfryxellense]MBU3114736.1 ABC transporter permease [Clostridium lacusfryxellense]
MNTKIIEKKTLRKKILSGGSATQKLLAFSSLIVMFLAFSIVSPNFATFDNIVGILLATSVTGVLAIGATFVIITSGIDLSIGTVMTFSAVFAGLFITNMGLPVFVGVLGGIVAGGLCGFLNGTAIAKAKIPPFIATLGMMMITKGLSLVLSNAKPIYFNDTPSFAKISMGSFLGIPNAVLIFFAVAIIASLILSKTVLGRYNVALGSNEEAARLSGINVDKWKIAIYTLCGIFAGIAGIMMAARLNSAQPALGAGYEMDAIAAAVIGGTSLSGGEGTIIGTVIGAFIISVLTNGLRIMSVPQEWQTIVTGCIVILAVYMDIKRRKK